MPRTARIHANATARRTARIVAWLAVLGAVGSGVMTLAHLGVEIPLFEGLRPGLIPPAAAGFAVGTLLYAVLAVGAFGLRRWTWPVGLGVNVLAFLSAAFPYRGIVSAAAMVVSGLAIIVLLTPAGRTAFRSMP